jgi:hypothetical protein
MFLPYPALPRPMCPQDTTVGRGRTTAVEAIHAVTAPTLPRKPTRHSISPNASKGGPASGGGCCDAACVAYGPRVGHWCCSRVHTCVCCALVCVAYVGVTHAGSPLHPLSGKKGER